MALRSTAGLPEVFFWVESWTSKWGCVAKKEDLHPRLSEKHSISRNQKLHPFVLTSFPNTTGSSYGYMTGTWQVLFILCGPGLWAHAPEKDHLQRSEAGKFASHRRWPTQGAQLSVFIKIHSQVTHSPQVPALLPTFCRWQIWVTWLSTIATGQTGTAALISKKGCLKLKHSEEIVKRQIRVLHVTCLILIHSMGAFTTPNCLETPSGSSGSRVVLCNQPWEDY